MKKSKFILAGLSLFLVIGLIFTGCGNGGDGDDEEPLPQVETLQEGYLRINIQGNHKGLYLWAWKDIASEESSKCLDWNKGGIPLDHYNGDFTCVDIKLNDPASSVGLIVKSYDGNTKYTGDGDVIFYFPKKYNEIYFKNGSGTIYINEALTEEPVGTSSATITGIRTITLACNGVDLKKENVTLTNKNGDEVGITEYNSDKKTI